MNIRIRAGERSGRVQLRLLISLLASMSAGSAVLLTLLLGAGAGSLPIHIACAPAVTPPGWYFGKSQWKADARTLAAAARYVFIDSTAADPLLDVSQSGNVPLTRPAVETVGTDRNPTQVPPTLVDGNAMELPTV